MPSRTPARLPLSRPVAGVAAVTLVLTVAGSVVGTDAVTESSTSLASASVVALGEPRGLPTSLHAVPDLGRPGPSFVSSATATRKVTVVADETPTPADATPTSSTGAAGAAAGGGEPAAPSAAPTATEPTSPPETADSTDGTVAAAEAPQPWVSPHPSAPLARGASSVSSLPTTEKVSQGGRLAFGSAGDTTHLSTKAGVPLARHIYGHFQRSVPTGAMITVNAQGLPWATVANAKPGTSLHADIVRWAKTVKSRGYPIQLAFGHEPEAAIRRDLGTPSEYKAAWRNVVTIFRQQGVTNVKWTFQATAWGFRAKSTADNYAPRYYPGDDLVEVIGGDAYNWHTCGKGSGVDEPLSRLASGVLSFAKSRGKKASLPEFAATTSVDRVRWLSEGYTWLKQNRATFVSAYYFHRPDTQPNVGCDWPLYTASEYAAVAKIAKDDWSKASN